MENRKAYHNYFIESTYIAGMVLLGSEVKALRENKIGFNGAYIYIKNEELFVKSLYIGDYKMAVTPHDNLRERKLLLTGPELKKVQEWLKIKGNTIVPLQLFTMNNVFKLKIGLAKGKKQHDKREDLKTKDAEKEIKQKLKNHA